MTYWSIPNGKSRPNRSFFTTQASSLSLTEPQHAAYQRNRESVYFYAIDSSYSNSPIRKSVRTIFAVNKDRRFDEASTNHNAGFQKPLSDIAQARQNDVYDWLKCTTRASTRALPIRIHMFDSQHSTWRNVLLVFWILPSLEIFLT